MTYAEVADAHAAVQYLLKIPLPVAPTGLKLRRMNREFGDYVKDLEAERLKLIHEYAILDAVGSPVLSTSASGTQKFTFEPARELEYNKKFAELVQVTLEVATHPIQAVEFGSEKIPGEILCALGPMLEEVENVNSN